MNTAVIVSALRTPVGSFGGQFKDVPATELGAMRNQCRARARRSVAARKSTRSCSDAFCRPDSDRTQLVRRRSAAGLPKEVPATTINMLCGSGLKSVAIAAQMIRAGDADIVIAGGMENMTRAPYLMPAARFGARMGRRS